MKDTSTTVIIVVIHTYLTLHDILWLYLKLYMAAEFIIEKLIEYKYTVMLMHMMTVDDEYD